jgi:FdrA protein
MPAFNFVRRSFYRDSVTLMRLSLDMEAVAGVTRAAAMMGTPANRALLEQAGLLTADGDTAGPADLIIAVLAGDAATAERARAAADAALVAAPPTTATAAETPRTLAGGLRVLPGANVALISVPGLYAGAEARRALEAGLHVMLFSDNVPVATEVELKRLALQRGLWLLGPDCGTAILDGVPLGFANAVPRGRIGLTAASGTGLQEVTCAIARAGQGVSQAIGVGGRDLSDEVGGLMILRALDALAADGDTDVVCVVGKPPGPATAARLASAVQRLGKPSVIHLASAASQDLRGFTKAGVTMTETLEDCARAAVALARRETPTFSEFSLTAEEIERRVAGAARGLTPRRRAVRGVFAGGTLAWEARALLAARLADVAAGVRGGDGLHRVVDLGDDAFTLGRPHPMIDGRVRREWIEREASDPATAVLLLDVVLGYGAHPDPAGELLPALGGVRGVALVASVCGTDADPQRRSVQAETLRAAGVVVMDSNAQAARLAALIALRAGAARA